MQFVKASVMFIYEVWPNFYFIDTTSGDQYACKIWTFKQKVPKMQKWVTWPHSRPSWNNFRFYRYCTVLVWIVRQNLRLIASTIPDIQGGPKIP